MRANMTNVPAATEICYEVNGTQLHGLTYGDKSGELLLCLHGWLDNAASFMPLFPFLSEKKIIAIDWPGHGLSSHRSDDAHYHFVDWVYDLLQLFELNQWHKVDIVAHSMGGMVASAFAAAFPEKVKSLTLIDSIGFLSSKAEQTTSQLREGMLSRLAGANKQKNLHTNIESAIAARVQVSDLQDEHAALIVNRGLNRQGDGYVWRSDSRLRMKSPYRLTLAQAEQFIRDIETPVQLIHGDNGIDMVASCIKHYGPLFQNLSYYELVGGHHVHMEQPKQTATLITDFIETSK
jgi:pimeloyl-ACP methyl ester carboxylesterase